MKKQRGALARKEDFRDQENKEAGSKGRLTRPNKKTKRLESQENHSRSVSGSTKRMLCDNESKTHVNYKVKTQVMYVAGNESNTPLANHEPKANVNEKTKRRARSKGRLP